jgi:fibronectin-binding autotransporter adhesin
VMSISNSQVTRNQAGAGGGIATGDAGGDSSLTISATNVSFNSVKGPQSFGGGIGQIASADNANITITGSILVGNLARQGLGGAIGNLSTGGSANVSIASTTIGSTTLTRPYTLNPNQAQFGGGIFNGAFAGPASVSLGPGALVVGNQASIDGGGIFNADGATLLNLGATILLNHPDNIVNDPTF